MKSQSKVVLLMTALSLLATVAHAQLTVLNSTVPAGFKMTGFIQAATLNQPRESMRDSGRNAAETARQAAGR